MLATETPRLLEAGAVLTVCTRDLRGDQHAGMLPHASKPL